MVPNENIFQWKNVETILRIFRLAVAFSPRIRLSAKKTRIEDENGEWLSTIDLDENESPAFTTSTNSVTIAKLITLAGHVAHMVLARFVRCNSLENLRI